MASESVAPSFAHTRPRLAPWVAEAAFVALLLLVFVGLEPFKVRDAANVIDVSGSGNMARQLCYLLIFAVVVAAAYDKRALSAFAFVPVSLLLLLGWCFLSAAWAHEPGITIRRAGLEFIVVTSTMLSVSTVGPERALRLCRHVFAGILIVNWISIPIVPQAVHLPGEADPSLVGDWRGLFFHKNIAGAVSAVSSMIFLYYFLRTRRRIEMALFVAAIGFLIMTHSKSSTGFLPAALIAGAVYRLAWKRDIDRMIVAVGAVLLVVVVIGAIASHTEQIARILQDPSQFTGRTAIWKAEAEFVRDHTLLGAGYGTFADTGGKSPLHNYVDNKWVATVAHGHNGYLQLMVTIGLVGFILAMTALVILPMAAFWPRDMDNLPLKSLLFSIFVFVLLHNLLESDYLESDGPGWVTFLITIAMMRSLRPSAIGWRRESKPWQPA